MPSGRLGVTLRRIREQKGLTQEVVAKKAGVSTPYVSMLESEVRKAPSLPTLKRLVKALGVRPARLLE